MAGVSTVSNLDETSSRFLVPRQSWIVIQRAVLLLSKPIGNPSTSLLGMSPDKVFWHEVIKWLGNFSCLSTKQFSPQLCLGFLDDTTALLLHQAILIGRYNMFLDWINAPPTFARTFHWNSLTCLEVKRHFSFKNGLLAKFNKNGELSSLNRKINFRFVSNVFVLLILVSLCTSM